MPAPKKPVGWIEISRLVNPFSVEGLRPWAVAELPSLLRGGMAGFVGCWRRRDQILRMKKHILATSAELLRQKISLLQGSSHAQMLSIGRLNVVDKERGGDAGGELDAKRRPAKPVTGQKHGPCAADAARHRPQATRQTSNPDT